MYIELLIWLFSSSQSQDGTCCPINYQLNRRASNALGSGSDWNVIESQKSSDDEFLIELPSMHETNSIQYSVMYQCPVN